MTYAILSNGRIALRGLPTMTVAKRIAATRGGKAIIDPRCIVR